MPCCCFLQCRLACSEPAPRCPSSERLQAGCVFISIMLFMAVTASGSAELIAVSSLVAYDVCELI